VSAVLCPAGEYYTTNTYQPDNTPKCYACTSRAPATVTRVEEEFNSAVGGFTAKCHYSDGVQVSGVEGGEPSLGDVISPSVALPSSDTEYATMIRTPMPADGSGFCTGTQTCSSNECTCLNCPGGFQQSYDPTSASTEPTCVKCPSSHPLVQSGKCYASSCGAGVEMRCPWSECGCYQQPQDQPLPPAPSRLIEYTVISTVSCPAGLLAGGQERDVWRRDRVGGPFYSPTEKHQCYACPESGNRVELYYEGYAEFTTRSIKCVGPSTCGNACAAAISSIDDETLSLMKTGFTVSHRPRRVPEVARTRSKRVCMRVRSGVRQGVQKGVSVALTQLPVQACGQLPDSDGRRNMTVYATYFSYQMINARATECGLPASTVTLTPPAPNTCDGAITRLMTLEM
jgi:hypothetical protein